MKTPQDNIRYKRAKAERERQEEIVEKLEDALDKATKKLTKLKTVQEDEYIKAKETAY